MRRIRLTILLVVSCIGHTFGERGGNVAQLNILQPSKEPATVGSMMRRFKMSREEASGERRDVTFAYRNGVPRNEKCF